MGLIWIPPSTTVPPFFRFRSDDVLCISAVDGVSCDGRELAKILAPGAAVFAFSACAMQPGYADPVSWPKPECTLASALDDPHHLMARNYGRFQHREFALD